MSGIIGWMSIDRRVAEFVAEAAAAWDCPDLVLRVEVQFSRRLRSAAGRALPTRSVVRLHAALADGSRELLREVVIHELAHIVSWERYGRTPAHGREWRELVRRANGTVRVRLPAGTLPATGRRGALWRHTCPVCRASRTARRPVRGWRCRRCLDAGRSGELGIERIDP